jgi:hypothetical protein
MSPKRKEALDRRDAAVHEAGHLVVARKFQQEDGVWNPAMAACIFRVDGTTPAGRTWNGDFNFFPFSMPPAQKAMVGVAGIVAVTQWRRQCLSDINWKEPDTLSPRDWDFCGCEPGKPQIDLRETAVKVAALVERETGPLWSELCVEARHLIKNGVVKYGNYP